MLSIVLRRSDFRESDQLVSLLTLEKGKMVVLAKGVKKITSKNSAFLEPFFLVEAEIIQGKEIWRLGGVQPVEVYKNIRADLDKSLLAAKAVELIDSLTRENEREPRLFSLLKHWLDYLNDKNVGRGFFYGFVSRLFSVFGFAPLFSHCAACGETSVTLVFSPASGGLLCQSCVEKKKKAGEELFLLVAGDIKAWQLFLAKDLSAWPSAVSPMLIRAIWSFAEYHSEKRMPRLFGKAC